MTQKSSSCDYNFSHSMTTPLIMELLSSREDNSSLTKETGALTATICEENTAVGWMDDLELKGLSCLEILNVAQASVNGENQSQCLHVDNVNINQEATGVKEKKADVENKKRKADLDLNEKPIIKRQKYYWAKINDSNKRTPKPKTPKAKTPKPARKKYEKKIDKEVKNDESCAKCINFDVIDNDPFPRKSNNQESFKCVLSLLSMSMNVRKKKRSTKRLPKKYQYSLPEQCTSKSVKVNKASLKFDVDSSNGRKKERKAKVVKKKKDALSELHDWCDKSLEQMMDPIIHEFETLNLYDDPKKLETWSIIVKPQEESELMAEKIIMKEKALRFILTMRIFQGRKDFVEWKGSVLDSVVGVFLTQNVSDVLSSNAYMKLASKYPISSPIKYDEESLDSLDEERIYNSSQGSSRSPIIELPKDEYDDDDEKGREQYYSKALKDMLASLPDLHSDKEKDEKSIDWEAIRVQFVEINKQRSLDTKDSVDWEAVRKAPVGDIPEIIKSRGQHRIIAAKIQKTLNRLVDDHGTLDLEWLRKAPSKVAKAYLLSIYGLGLKSVECLRLLTLKDHGGFPVDVNIKRIAVRLGWVPLQELPDGMSFHLIEKYPLENDVQQYLLPRLSELTQEQRYELHYQMITFGKVFCTKKNPNCRACPFKGECEYYKSQLESVKQNKPLLSWKKDGRLVISRRNVNNKKKKVPNPFDIRKEPTEQLNLSGRHNDSSSHQSHKVLHSTTIPIVQQPDDDDDDDDDVKVVDIEDLGKAIVVKQQDEVNNKVVLDLNDILKNVVDGDGHGDGGGSSIDITHQRRPTCMPNVKNVVSDLLRALVCADGSIPLPKHKNPTRLRTEHQVYELPYDHPLLKDMDRQEGEMPYLLAIFPQAIDSAEEASSSEPFSDERTVPGTILIPVRTALRGYFPLNGTYFQVNEIHFVVLSKWFKSNMYKVFVDHETSLCPLKVPTELIWNLPKRTLYCGTGATSIYRGLSGKEIIKCNWSGFICTRAFNRKTRGPEDLPFIFHKRAQEREKGNK